MKCADLINQAANDRVLTMARCLGTSTAAQDRYERFMENILAVDSYRVHRVCLSWGGPADYLEIHTRDGEVQRVFYEYQEWFDGARIELTGRAFEKVEQMFSYLAEEYQ